MKLDQLNTFLMACEQLNFSQAARRLHLSQSAVSQQIRELEEDLGVTLFERRGRGLLLAPAGERLRRLATPILRDLQHVRADLSAFRGIAQGVLRIGASNTPGVYMLPHALGRYSQSYPGVRVSLGVSHTEAVVASLQAGEIDLAVVEEEPPSHGIHGWDKVAFLEDELVLIVPPGHRWARQGRVGLEELPGEPYIFRQQASRTRRLILDCLSDAGLAPERLNTRFELGNTEGIKHAVMAGLGVGFVSRHAATVECRAGLLREVAIDGVAIRRTLWLLKPPPEKAFVHLERFCALLGEPSWLPSGEARP